MSENLLQPSFFYAFCLTWLHVNNNFAPTLGGNASTISKLEKFIKKYLMRRFKKLEWNVQSTNLMMPCQREYRISLMVVFLRKNIRYTLRLSCKNANTNTERCKHLLLKLKRYSLEKHLFLTHHNRPKVLSRRRSSCHYCVTIEKLWMLWNENYSLL